MNIGNTWLVEGGVGCGSGPRGVRGELMLGYHGKRDIDGTPGPWTVPPSVDPLHTSVTTTTLMFNGYYDIAQVRPLHALRRRRRRPRLQQDRQRLFHRQSRRSSMSSRATTAGRWPGR